MDESKTLRDGIAFWRDRPNWPADFHNSQYRQWALENPHGDFTIEWWQPFAARLRRWGAIRPIPAAQLETRFLESAPELSTTWHRSCEPVADRDITTVAWDTIGPFADLVAIIKPTKHPSSVFTSKFCHFLLPGVFPVVDDAALGASGTSYKQHYTTVKNLGEPARQHPHSLGRRTDQRDRTQ